MNVKKKNQNYSHQVALNSGPVIATQKDFLQSSWENYHRKQKSKMKWNVEGDEQWKVSVKSYADVRL